MNADEGAPRGLTKRETDDLRALQIFLEEYGVVDIDVEPSAKGAGYTISASGYGKGIKFTSWGIDIRTAVNNMVRSITAGQR